MVKDTSAKTSSQVTIKDVARRAGVGITTVSAALNGTGRVSETQAERLRLIAKEIGYQPKLAAQLLRANSTGHVGLLMMQLHTRNWKNVFKAGHAGSTASSFVQLCEERSLKFHLDFLRTCREEGDVHIPKIVSGGLVDGLLVEGAGMPTYLNDWLAENKIPWVQIDEPADHCVLSKTDDGIYRAVERLAALGHKRIAFIGGPTQYEMHRLGRLGYDHAVEDFSIDTGSGRFVMHMDLYKYGLKEAADWSKPLLLDADGPTAYVCSGMRSARGVVHMALTQGLKVPEDVSVITLGNEEEAMGALPMITSIEVDYAELVSKGLYMLQSLLDGTLKVPKTEFVSPNLVLRESVGRCLY